MVAVVAEPEENASAKRAFSSAATAFSKLSLKQSVFHNDGRDSWPTDLGWSS